jgi:hypothetical protein
MLQPAGRRCGEEGDAGASGLRSRAIVSKREPKVLLASPVSDREPIGTEREPKSEAVGEPLHLSSTAIG